MDLGVDTWDRTPDLGAESGAITPIWGILGCATLLSSWKQLMPLCHSADAWPDLPNPKRTPHLAHLIGIPGQPLFREMARCEHESGWLRRTSNPVEAMVHTT